MTIRLIFATWRCCTLAFSFWLTLLTFTLWTLPFLLLRSLVNALLTRQYPTWGALLDLADSALWEDLDSETSDTLNCVLLFGAISEGDLSLSKLQHFFTDYVLKHKTFRGDQPYSKFLHYQQTCFGYPVWRPRRDFDIADHVKYLPEFLNRDFVTREDLETFLGEYHGKPFGRRQPPWELLIVKKYVESEDELENGVTPSKFVLLFRWHHTLADTASISRIFVNILGGETRNFKNPGTLSRPMSQGPVICWPHYQDSWVAFWWTALRQNIRNMVQLGQEALAFLLSSDTNIWRVSQDMLTGTSHLVSTKKLPFNIARLVSKKQDVNVASILYTAVAGGIRQYFVETGQARRVPKEMRIRVSLPFNKDRAVLGLRNFWSVGNISLPVGEPTPLKRLHFLQESTTQLQQSWLPTLLYFVRLLQQALPGGFFSKYNFHNRRTTLVGMNFPGPSEEVRLLGEYPALEFMSFHPRLLSDAAVGLSILSYNGSIRFFLSVDKTLFPSRSAAVKLAKLIEREFLDLQNVHEAAGDLCH